MSCTHFELERESSAALSPQERSVLSRQDRDKNQAGIISSSVCLSVSFSEGKAQPKLNPDSTPAAHGRVFCHRCSSKILFTGTKQQRKFSLSCCDVTPHTPLTSMTGQSESRTDSPALLSVSLQDFMT